MRKNLYLIISRFDWVILVLVTPFLLFPYPKWSPLMLVIPGLWLLSLISGEPVVVKSPFNLSLLLLGLAMLVSVFVTFDMSASLPKFAGIILGLGAYFTVLHLSRRKSGWWVALAVFLIIGSGIALMGLASTNWVTTKFKALAPLLAKLPTYSLHLPGSAERLQPNEVAGALLWVLPVLFCLAAALIFRPKRLKSQALSLGLGILLLLATLFVGGVLLLTQSRSAWLGLAAAVIIAIFLIIPLRARLALLVFVLLSSSAAWYFLSKVPTTIVGTNPLEGGPDTLATNPGLSLSDLQLREVIWYRAIIGFQDFPLTGMGMNIFRQELVQLYPWYGIDYNRDYGHAHNEFLQAGLDLGLLGLLAFASLNLIAFWTLRRSFQLSSIGSQGSGKTNNQVEISPRHLPVTDFFLKKTVLLGLGTALLAHLIYGLTDAVALGAKPGILFWMLLSLIAGSHEKGL